MAGFFGGILVNHRNAISTSDLLSMVGGGASTNSGVAVTENNAFKVATVLSCARFLTMSFAHLPGKLLKFEQSGGYETRTAATDHPLYEILSVSPNEWQTAMEFFMMVELHRIFKGNAYAFINRVRGQIKEIIPLDVKRVTPKMDEKYKITYEVESENGKKQVFPKESIWHIRGLSWDGFMGLDIIKMAAETIGLAIATEKSQAQLHGSGIRPSGLYSVDGKLTEEQYKQLRKWIEDNNAGPQNFGRVMLLDNGAKWTPSSMTGVDAQHLETRKFQQEEMCLAMGVYPQVIGIGDKAPTYASAEQFFGAQVVNNLVPTTVLYEQSIAKNLLTKEDRKKGLYFKFNVNGLLRGSTKERGEYYAKLYSIGAINPNEIRSYEDLNPYDGGEAYRVPLNMEPANGDEPENRVVSRMAAGRVLSSVNEQRIRDAGGKLDDVLSSLDKQEE